MSTPRAHNMLIPSSRIHSIRRCRTLVTLLATGIALGGLTGCSNDSDDSTTVFAPTCPTQDIPGMAADRVVYNGKGADIRHLVSHTRIVGIRGDCSAGPQDERHRPLTRVRVSLDLQHSYGPAFQGKTLEIPYFIAIVRDGKIVDKKIFSLTLTAKDITGTQKITTPLRFIDLPTGSNLQASPYTLEAGFQLSHSELEYNRSHLRPAQFEKNAP